MNTLHKRRLLNTRRTRRKKGIPWWLTALLGLAVLGSVGAVAGVGALLMTYQAYADDYVPIEEKLRQTNVGLTTIYDREGVELGSLTNPDAQLLEPVPLDRISDHMINATISTEDNEFWDHPGVNVTGLMRAGFEYLSERETGGGTGGSSITQQLIKNVYICPSIGEGSRDCVAERTVKRKLKEIAFALELEQDYSKEEILAWYLNQISYADRYIGVQAAADGYFHKDSGELTLAEAALLAGIPQFPTDYHPRLNCLKDEAEQYILDELARCTVGGAAKERQEAVLDLMVEHDRATREEVDAAKAEPLKVYLASNELKAEAFIDNQVEPRLVRMCEKGQLPLNKDASDCTQWVHAAGWKVTTTLDWQATDDAMEMIRGFIDSGLAAGCDCNNGAIATIDPRNGQIMIYAPNRDPSYTSDPRVAGKIDQLNEVNQPGSSFKPAVYLTWMDTLKKHPYSSFWDTSPLTVEGVAITNPRTGGPTEGMISARAGLGGSQNVPAFRAAQEGGVDNVIAMAKKLGITTLEQNFDPTFVAHSDVQYGASIATGGANIRAIDMAYMDTVIANMGVMVGVPHYAETVELGDLKGTFTAGEDASEWELAVEQKLQFERGHIRLAGTRNLDPVVILEVKDQDGNLVWEMTDDKLVREEVVNPGSMWLLHSIMSDCNARFIIWSCGGSNGDLALSFFDLDGTRIPGGVKTGTQQGPLSASDTLETWMTGYTQYAGTAVWVGNATNELVNDRSFAAANATVRLFKNWMGTYHSMMKSKGVIPETYGDFSTLQPANVARKEIESVSTDRTLSGGGCSQKVTGWVRTDVTYESECEEKEIDTRNGLLAGPQTPAQYRAMRKFVKLPAFHPELAIELAKAKNIPIAPTEVSTGQSPLSIANLSNGKQITATTQVVGNVNVSATKNWKLEIGQGANPSSWTQIGSGVGPQNGQLGIIDIGSLQTGPYTVRLSVDDPSTPLSLSVVINVRKTPGQGDDDPEGEATRPPTTLPTPGG